MLKFENFIQASKSIMPKNYAIGIDVGGTNLRAALISETGEVIKKVKTASAGSVPESLQNAVKTLYTDNVAVAGIGIGIAGLLDRKNGVVLLSPNLHSVEGINFVEILHRQFSTPVFIENDANAAALGEKWMGAGREFNNFVLLTLGTGIGGGIVYEKKLLNASAEIGHISINADGEKCPCGNYGCLELYASASAINTKVVTALEKGSESILRECCKGSFYKITPEDIYKAALEGDNLAREALKDTGRYLGVGLANIINILSPEAVILAGGLIGAWNIYVQEAVREASKRTFKALFDTVKIIPAVLGDDAGIIGAAGLVFAASGRLQGE
ncbi:MAG: ROK family protein [Nitrospirae bacterium]|nr:MAG: ROK family protein [Nitrospirota bacterium]